MKAFQLKIMINKSKPPIWRRIVVPAGITFTQLGVLLDKVMEWEGQKDFYFEFYNDKIRIIENAKKYAGVSFEYDYIEASKIYIREYLEEYKLFTYIYSDDEWRQKITVEKIIEDYEYDYPQVLKYKGESPIEDCADIESYYIDLEIIDNPNNDEYNECLEWLESRGYPKVFDIDKINEELKNQFKYIWGKGEKRTYKKIYNDITKGKYGLRATKKDDNGEFDVYLSKRGIIAKLGEQFKMLHEAQNREKYSLKAIFNDFDKDDILEIYEHKKLKYNHKLSKDKLCDNLEKHMLDIDIARQYFMFQTDEIIKLFDEEINIGCKTYFAEMDNAPKGIDELYFTNYVGALENGVFMIPSEVFDVYKKIACDANFYAKRKKSRAILECLRAAGVLYGIIPITILMNMLKHYCELEITEAEVRMTIGYIPNELNKFELRGNNIYELTLAEIHDALMEEQMDKPYYIPTNEEIDVLSNSGFLDDPNKDELKNYFVKNLKISEIDAITICDDIQMKMMYGMDVHTILESVDEYELPFKNEKQLDKVISLIFELWNNTRMIINRGHSPMELIEFEASNYDEQYPNFFDDKEQYTSFFDEDEDNMNNVVPFRKKEDKVYPNSKCPCGSGKKYKFCCGRKK